jgi:hypothetical protein
LRGYPRKAREICSLNPEDCADSLGFHKKSATWTKRIARIPWDFTRNCRFMSTSQASTIRSARILTGNCPKLSRKRAYFSLRCGVRLPKNA